MFEELIHFWKTNVDIKSGNYIANADRPILSKYNPLPPHSFNKFIKSEEYGRKGSKKVHSGLLPRPYAGDIENARIYFLMINPGFGPWDYFDEENKDYRLAGINTLFQENLDPMYPFLYLNPKYCWTGGGRYWNKKLAPVVKEVKDQKNKKHPKNCSYQEALSFVSQRFAVFELFPYHSQIPPITNSDIKILPSCKIIKESIAKMAVEHPDRLFIVARKVGMWGLSMNKKNIITFTGGESRGANLSPKLDTIMKYLQV